MAAGAIAGIVTEVCSGSDQSNLFVDLEIYNAGGQTIAQRFFGGQTFAAGEGKTYSWNHPVHETLPPGEYTVKIGIFSGDWSTLHVWENHAADFTVQGGPPPPCAGVTILPTSATPSPVAREATLFIESRLCFGQALSNPLVDLGVYSETSGAKVAQQIFRGESFAPGEGANYFWHFVVPASFPDGPYRVKVGVFSGDWSTLYQWDDLAASFQVAGGAPLSGCTEGFTIGPTTATPSPVARGATATIQTQVCSGALAAYIIVDLEIYDAGGQKVAQQVFGGYNTGGQNFSAGETLSYTWPYLVEGTLAPGTYTVKIGVFSGDWSVLHTWENQAATLVVQ